MIIQRQVWYDYTKYLIVNEYCAVQLELCNKEQWYGGSAFIYGLYVCPLYRGKKHAEILLDQAEFCAKRDGYKAVFLEWEKKTTPEWVLEWYLRLGYEKVKSTTGGCILKKELI